ncbi:hypothetical protein [Streptomyces sp. NPDC051219]|uniref:hypothetical protein n=1 Tax=Streptomyces sp. NPDC051219 TaxID=3155283 RepID=UPI00342FEF52
MTKVVRIGFNTVGTCVVHVRCSCPHVDGLAAHFEHVSLAADGWLNQDTATPWEFCPTSATIQPGPTPCTNQPGSRHGPQPKDHHPRAPGAQPPRPAGPTGPQACAAGLPPPRDHHTHAPTHAANGDTVRTNATAQLTGLRDTQCDATAVRTAPTGARAYVLLDGIGSSEAVRQWTRTAARRLARAAAHRGDAEAGLRAVFDAYAAERAHGSGGPKAAAVVAVTVPGRPLTLAWCGDSRAYLITQETELLLERSSSAAESANAVLALIPAHRAACHTAWTLALTFLGTLVTDDPAYRSTVMPAPDPASRAAPDTDYASAAATVAEALALIDDNQGFDEARDSDPFWPADDEGDAVRALRHLRDTLATTHKTPTT